MADTTTAVMAPPSGPTTPPPGSPACKQFPFRLLPVEIRLMIYDLVFISPNPIRIDDPRLRHRPAVRHRRGASPDPVASLHPHGYHGYHDPAYRDLRGSDDTLPRGTMEMLLLSKAISAEIRYALYTKNTIEVSTKYHRAWFCTIGRPGPRPSNPTFAGQPEVAVLVEVEVRVAWNQRFTTWLERGRPDQPKPKLPSYPDIVMSSAKRHAVWKRKMESKERRRVESERLRLETEILWLEKEMLRVEEMLRVNKVCDEWEVIDDWETGVSSP